MVSASFPNRPFNLRDNVWFIQSDIVNNRSLVGWELWVDKRSYSPTYSFDGSAARWMTLNGAYVHNYGGVGFDFRNGNNFLLASGQTWIGHNADGTGGVNIAAAASFAILGATSLGSYISLPTIPRASTAVWAVQNTKYFGTTHQINLNPASSSFTHTVQWFFGNKSGTIGTGVGASVNWTIPADLIDQIPNSVSGNGTIRVYTYSGGTQIGVRDSGMILTAPTTAVPTIDDINITEATAGLAANVGKYVKGISTLALEIVGEAGISGSTITARKLEVLSGSTVQQSFSTDTATTAVINASGTVTIRATVTDSRGRTATLSKNITVLNYAPPALTSYSVKRALSNAVVDEDQGTYFRLNFAASISSLMNTTERNSWGYRAYTRPYSGGSWTLRSSGALTGTSFNSYKLFGTFALTSAYEVLLEVYDEFATTQVIIPVSVAAIFMHWDASEGVGFGKFRENGRGDFAGDVYARAEVGKYEGNFVPAPTGPGVVTDRLPHTGTTAQRDTYYGIPSTAAAKVALANRQVLFFNTDTGWWESYYAVKGTSGLTVRGLVTGLVADWYPVDNSGPRGRIRASGGQLLNTAGALFTNWDSNWADASNNYDSWRSNTAIYRDPADLAALRTSMAGRYKAKTMMTFPNGSGIGVWEFGAIDNRGNTYQLQNPVELYASYGLTYTFEFEDLLLFSTGRCYVKSPVGQWTIGNSSCYMTLEYLGPPLTAI
ncbi:minor tail protein [Microbacterium phage Triscuit]|nr:minor tail protein [Microbacterium phage Triscuit]